MRALLFILLSSFFFVAAPAFSFAADSGVNVLQFGATFHPGDRGIRVVVLQKLLASDPSIYPEGLVTGYYGPLTTAAVKRYQKRSGLEQVGNVGPLTLKRINAWLLQDQELSTANVGDNSGLSSTSTSAGSAAPSSPPSSSQSSALTFSTCTVVKSGVTMTMRWPDGLPCPKGDDVDSNITAPQPSTPSTSAQPSPQIASKSCPDPLNPGSTESWPASLPCPAVFNQGSTAPNTQTASQSSHTQNQTQTQSTSFTQTAAQSPQSNADALAQYGLTAPKLTDTTSCLGKLFSTQSLTDALSHITQCSASTLSLSELPADEASDKKTCTLTINGSVLSFPFPTNYPCPMQAIEGVPAGSPEAMSIGNSVNWSDFKPGTTGTTCTVHVNGQDLVFPWPSSVACTGTIPGL